MEIIRARDYILFLHNIHREARPAEKWSLKHLALPNFPGVEILWKGTGILSFHKISTPGN